MVATRRTSFMDVPKTKSSRSNWLLENWMIKKIRNFWRLRTDPPSTVFVPYNSDWVTRGIRHLGIWGIRNKEKKDSLHFGPKLWFGQTQMWRKRCLEFGKKYVWKKICLDKQMFLCEYFNTRKKNIWPINFPEPPRSYQVCSYASWLVQI